MTTQGKRVHPQPDEDWIFNLQPGEYGKNDIGQWFARTPNGLVGNLGGHTVVEHEDGTITVSPSILVNRSGMKDDWHGYLECGIWREV